MREPSEKRLRPACLLCILLAAQGTSACDGLGEFRTDESEIFAGTVIGQRRAGCETEPCSFVRRGFPEGLRVQLTFNPDTAGTRPGVISSSEGPCGRFFDEDPLLPITPLAHDDLSLLEFPGARIQNYIFALAPSAGPLQSRDVMAVLSLRDDGAIEVRLMSGSGARACEPDACDAFARGECDVFGVFPTTKMER